MCGIVAVATDYTNHDFNGILYANAERGRDGFGIYNSRFGFPKYPGEAWDSKKVSKIGPGLTLANFRAEPTTEAVIMPTVEDQQPYTYGPWTIVHNGTIANDKELIQKYGFSPPTEIDSWVIVGLLVSVEKQMIKWSPLEVFRYVVELLKGSYSIFAFRQGTGEIFYATNYRPLYHYTDKKGTCVSSVRFPRNAQRVPPYSIGSITERGLVTHVTFPFHQPKRALVVLSGGLDSTVAAAQLISKGYEVEFVHFDYGARATRAERKAVESIAAFYKLPLRVVPLNNLFTQVIGHSRLVDPSAKFAPSIEGSELAIEWVPARNSIMAMIAMGIAEAHDFGYIALGINNEESGGGYTDNVLDLYQGFNDLNHWIVGVNRRVEFLWPLGSLMKRHIVELGLSLNAPLHLTWSCYNNGNMHCGDCGPCFMRRTAFEINGAKDPVFFAEEV